MKPIDIQDYLQNYLNQTKTAEILDPAWNFGGKLNPNQILQISGYTNNFVIRQLFVQLGDALLNIVNSGLISIQQISETLDSAYGYKILDFFCSNTGIELLQSKQFSFEQKITLARDLYTNSTSTDTTKDTNTTTTNVQILIALFLRPAPAEGQGVAAVAFTNPEEPSQLEKYLPKEKILELSHSSRGGKILAFFETAEGAKILESNLLAVFEKIRLANARLPTPDEEQKERDSIINQNLRPQ